MYKIILADDEPVIIRGLKKMIDWKGVNAQVIGEAENGVQLLELIGKLQPDILISDISMPHATGLDVIREINKNEWETKVIFLTGFQEFNYAKDAITYGAVDYLLKPVGKEELEHSILKAEKQLQKGNPMELWEEEDSVQAVFKDMSSNGEYSDLYRRFQEMGIETEDKLFAGVCFAMSNEAVQSFQDMNKLELIRFNIYKRIQDYLKKEKLGFVIKREDNSSNIIYTLPRDLAKDLLNQSIEGIKQMILKEYNVKLMIGIGETVSDINELKYAYKTARFAYELHYFQQEPIIYYQNISREFHQSFEDYSAQYKAFLNDILHKNDTWIDGFVKCLEIIENLHYGNRYAAENRCIVLAMDLYRDLKEYNIVNESGQADYENWMQNLRKQNTYQGLKDVFSQYIRHFIEEAFHSQGSSDNTTVRQVKEYIKEYYAEDISLGQIAKMVYMNPYYFSTFFKKETGQNFKNYVTEVRMKQALKILQESDIKTYELAWAVGYKDVRTFTDKFKEVYGDSPSGYKKKSL